jgi:hypothetical protein
MDLIILIMEVEVVSENTEFYKSLDVAVCSRNLY